MSKRARELVGIWLWCRETARQEGGWYIDLPSSGDQGAAATQAAEETYELLLAELGGDDELRRALVNNMVLGTPLPEGCG